MAITISGSGITSANIADGTIVNADVADVAASKLTGALPAIDGSALTGMSGGLYESIAIICDRKSAGTGGGVFTSGAWRTRDLNTEVSDVDNIVSISSNQFTLVAGTYTIKWVTPAHKVNAHASALYNITTSSFEEYSNTAYNQQDTWQTSHVSGMAVVSGSQIFEIQHRCQTTQSAVNGMGYHINNVDSSADTNYTLVEIYKHT